MFKKNHKFLSVFFAIVLIASALPQSSYATNIVKNDDFSTATVIQPEITPLWQNVTGATFTVDFPNSTIALEIVVGGKTSTTTFTNGVVTLTKMSGSDMGIVKKWVNLSSNNSVFRFYDNSLTPTKGTYRLSLTIDAVRNGVSETVTAFKDATYSG